MIGDSASDPYRPIGRGGPDSYAWTELARDWRDVNFGPNGDSYIVASSGDTTADIAVQVAELAAPIQSGEIWEIIEFIGANDLYPMCHTHYSARAYDMLRNTMLANFENGIVDLINLGMSSNDIYIVTQGERNALQSCSNYVQYNQMVGELNAGLANQSNQYGFHLIDVSNAISAISRYVVNENGDISISGYMVYNEYCNYPWCQWVSDGHTNTVLNGITLNSLFASVLDIAPMSNDEIVQAAGLK